MKLFRVCLCLVAALLLAGRLAVAQMPEPEKEPEVDPAAENALRTVSPDERKNESDLYWEFAKSMEHGTILFISRGSMLMVAVHFEAFPKWSRDRKGGAITVNFLASPRYEPEPRSPSYHLDEYVRVIPQDLLEHLEKTWDRVLKTARVDGDHHSFYMMDGVTYEFRGGPYGSFHPYVACAQSPHAGISGYMGALADALIDYCAPDEKGHRLEVKDIEKALQGVEAELKNPTPPEPIKPPELPKDKP